MLLLLEVSACQSSIENIQGSNVVSEPLIATERKEKLRIRGREEVDQSAYLSRTAH